LDRAEMVKCELATESLRSSGKLRFEAMGWSMMPTLWPRDIVEINRADGKNVAIGDIVLFVRTGKLCAHRVVSKSRGADGDIRFTTQGDSLPMADLEISSRELLGKVCLISRGKQSFQPSSKLSFCNRAMRSILRRSTFTSRVLARLHTMRQHPKECTAECRC